MTSLKSSRLFICTILVLLGYSVLAEYNLISITDTIHGFNGILELSGLGSATYGPDLKDLSIDVIFQSEHVIEIKINALNDTR